MKIKILIKYLVVPLVIMLSSTNLILSGRQENSPDGSIPKKIIRMDLLITKDKKFDTPTRNIFMSIKDDILASQSRVSTSTVWGNSLDNLGINKQQGISRSDKTNIKKVLGLGHNLKYLGYVTSLEKKVALLSYKGHVFAVEKGSILPEGIEIVDISLDHVTIKSPGSDKIDVKLEREEK